MILTFQFLFTPLKKHHHTFYILYKIQTDAFSNHDNLFVHPICYSDSNLIQRNLLNKRIFANFIY